MGDVQFVTASFGANLGHVDRLTKRELGGGAALDLGVYTLQLALLVLGEEPEKVLATGFLNEHGRDLDPRVFSLNCVHT